MRSLRWILYVLLLLITTIRAGSVSGVPVVKVEYNGTAVLPCSGRCSGVVSWTRFGDSSDPLAVCDQSSCRSVKEGYQMIHNQYLQGNFSLIISEADFSKRGTYTCDCDDTDISDVQLQIDTLKKSVPVKSGENLVLDLFISDKVEVIYNSTGEAGSSSHQICRVDRRSVQLSREYSERASVSSVFTLRRVEESDGGVYIVRDNRTKEILCIYTVIIHGKSEVEGQEQKPSPAPGEGATPQWALIVMGVALLVSVLGNMLQCKRNPPQCLQRRIKQYREANNKNNDIQNDPEEISLPDHA